MSSLRRSPKGNERKASPRRSRSSSVSRVRSQSPRRSTINLTELPEPVFELMYNLLEPKNQSSLLRTSKKISDLLNVNVHEESERLEKVYNANNELKKLMMRIPLNTERIKKLIEEGADPNITNNNNTLLTAAITYPDLMDFLLENGANINKKTPKSGHTVLMIAADHPYQIQKLIDAGAKLDLQNNYGETALIRAVELGQPKSVKRLLKAGANPNIRDNEGKTALNYARKEKNYFKKIGEDTSDYDKIIKLLTSSSQ